MRVGNSRHAATVSLVAVALCTACAPIPEFGTLPAPRAAQPLVEGVQETAETVGWPDVRWWDAYRDPQLSAIIEQGLATSPSLDEASARVRRAEAIAEQSGARLLPSVDASAQGGAVKLSENLGLPPGINPTGWQDAASTSLSISYDLDLWGKNRATLRAALSDAEAARADEAAARLALSTGIASTYSDLMRLSALRKTAEANLRIRSDSLKLIAARHEQGLENDAAQARSESARMGAAADLTAVDEQIELTRHQLAALVGAGPAFGQTITLPAAPALHAMGLPEDLGLEMVGRRPDIAAARLRSEALAERIRATRADFFPNIRLSALIGLQAVGIGDLIDGGSNFGAAGPAISLPIFSGGRLEGSYRGVRADFDASVAAYDQTLIQAVREIADVATRQRALSSRLAQSRAALAASEHAYELIQARYRGGLAPYFEVLSAEDALNANRRTVADLEANAFTLDVALVRALGGGFRQSNS